MIELHKALTKLSKNKDIKLDGVPPDLFKTLN